MFTHKRLASTVLAVLLAMVVFVSPNAASADTDMATLRSQWNDFLHYIRMARPKLAKSFGNSLIEQATPQQMYQLSIEAKTSQAILVRGMQLEGLKDTVLKIRKMIDKGYVLVRSDEAEIKRTIELLGGNLRQYARASNLLVTSGEYAIPQLMVKLGQPDTSAIVRERISEVLPRIGKEAVRPLCEILGSDNKVILRHAVIALGKIQYPHAAAQLKALYDQTKLGSLRKLTASALVACSRNDTEVLGRSTADLFYQNAKNYYNKHHSILPDSRYGTANIWYLEDGVLVFKKVPREIFCDIYTMRMARKALQVDCDKSAAVSLWLAGYLRREINLPDGKTDPLILPGTPSAGDYIRAAGAGYAQEVLAIGLNDCNSELMIGAIEAMRDVAGASNLVMSINNGAQQPLVQAASNPDLRVRLLAAEVLALALPTKPFEGSQVVIPVLSDALRQSTGQRVAIIGPQGAAMNTLKDELRKKNYEVLTGNDPIAIVTDIRQAGGADLAIILEAAKVFSAVDVIRQDIALKNLPVIALTREQAITKSDKKVLIVAPESSADEIIENIAKAKALSAGEALTSKEATEWAIRAAKALELLAMTNNTVYDVSLAQKALVDALGDSRSDVQVAAANALAYQKSAKAQQAIADLALNKNVSKNISIAAFNALTESVKRFGRLILKKQADMIVEVVKNSTSKDVRTAAAKALGALNLPSQQIKPLIIETKID